MCVCVCVCMYVHVYIYIYNVHVCMYVCVYVLLYRQQSLQLFTHSSVHSSIHHSFIHYNIQGMVGKSLKLAIWRFWQHLLHRFIYYSIILHSFNILSCSLLTRSIHLVKAVDLVLVHLIQHSLLLGLLTHWHRRSLLI